MAHTAQDEHYGNSLDVAGSVTLPNTTGQGCARVIRCTMGDPAQAVTLPDARELRPGSRAQIAVYANTGTQSFSILRNDGTELVATVTAGNCVVLRLAENDTQGGTWLHRTSSFTASTGLAAGRFPLEFRFTSRVNSVNLVDWAGGTPWDGTQPLALTVKIAPDTVIGSNTTSGAGLSVMGFPAGTTLVLLIEGDQSYIVGRGGAGGRGGDAPSGLLAQAGQAGGLAFETDVDVFTLISYGQIHGGGGGGGGGARSPGNAAGGGGGGGAGLVPSVPGTGGIGQGGLGSGQTGNAGTLFTAGGGGLGGNNGGGGGSPGSAGTTAGAAGGAAGVAIEYSSALTTYNPIRTGTILGAVNAV